MGLSAGEVRSEGWMIGKAGVILGERLGLKSWRESWV